MKTIALALLALWLAGCASTCPTTTHWDRQHGATVVEWWDCQGKDGIVP